MRIAPFLVVVLTSLSACKKKHEPQPRATGSAAPTPSPTGAADSKPVSRADYNRFAVRLNLPVFWVSDANNDGKPDKSEIAELLFYPTKAPDLDQAYAQISAAANAGPLDASTPEGKRRTLVQQDLDAGRPTLVQSDLTGLPDGDKAFVRQMLHVADLIDELFEVTNGAAALRSQVGADSESQSLFRRNRGPECVGPVSSKDPACSAIAGAPKVVYDIYPAELQKSDTFCKDLEARKDGTTLMGHFNVVRGSGDALTAVPFNEAYKDRMLAISAELEKAASLETDPKEKALVAYLKAAAKSFTTNDWNPADEAWADMSVDNSKWYVRVGPDETYWEPCAAKAGFHLGLARINEGSRAWQQKLRPVQQDMEAAIAAKAGAPYKARKVTFHLPDFIDVVINAGEDRKGLSTTLGQSLPNWGPLGESGRGRTWAALNIGTDNDTDQARRAQASSLFDSATLAAAPTTHEPDLLSTILHEATHNLGPAHDYKADGKTDDQAFGGPIAAMMEELKAQTGALFLVEMLRSRGLISDDLAKQSYIYCVQWGFGHISQGMYTATKASKAYGQLAAIQFGYLIDNGAITWDAAAPAANGTDKGAFTVHVDKFPAVADKMMAEIAGIKARGDRPAAEKLIARYVDSTEVVPHAIITERMLRVPRYSHVYSVKL